MPTDERLVAQKGIYFSSGVTIIPQTKLKNYLCIKRIIDKFLVNFNFFFSYTPEWCVGLFGKIPISKQKNSAHTSLTVRRALPTFTAFPESFEVVEIAPLSLFSAQYHQYMIQYTATLDVNIDNPYLSKCVRIRSRSLRLY